MLKTNYKDDLFEGERKYKITTDTAGKSTLEDVTEYTQKGTSFGALDMNNTNTAVNRLYGEKTATLTAAGWTSTAPYEQTIPIEGMLDTDRPFIECGDDLNTKAEKKKLRKEWDKVDRIITGEGQLTAYCNFEKPSLDLPLKIKGGVEMWTIIGGILATAGRNDEEDLNIYLTDNEGNFLIDDAGNFLICGEETE